jgi:hypothetical protein
MYVEQRFAANEFSAARQFCWTISSYLLEAIQCRLLQFPFRLLYCSSNVLISSTACNTAGSAFAVCCFLFDLPLTAKLYK